MPKVAYFLAVLSSFPPSPVISRKPGTLCFLKLKPGVKGANDVCRLHIENNRSQRCTRRDERGETNTNASSWAASRWSGSDSHCSYSIRAKWVHLVYKEAPGVFVVAQGKPCLSIMLVIIKLKESVAEGFLQAAVLSNL